MRQNQTLTLPELQAEVRGIIAARRMTQADAAEKAGVSRTYFNRALTATEHNVTLVNVLNAFLRRETGYVVEPEVTYRARRDG